MTRKQNTDCKGSKWSNKTIEAIWKKGGVILDFDSMIWRKDKCGLVIKFTEFGNRKDAFGWEIDHLNPVSNGGTDDLKNLQPLNWKNNYDKGDLLDWKCS